MCDLKYMDKDMDNKLFVFFIHIYIYIFDEAIHSQTTRRRDDQTDRKQTFHRIDTLQAGPVDQEGSDCF